MNSKEKFVKLIREGYTFDQAKKILRETTNLTRKNKKVKRIATGAAIGAVAGAATSATVGGMGLAVSGTAFAIGAIPLIAAGAIIGGLLGIARHSSKEDEERFNEEELDIEEEAFLLPSNESES